MKLIIKSEKMSLNRNNIDVKALVSTNIWKKSKNVYEVNELIYIFINPFSLTKNIHNKLKQLSAKRNGLRLYIFYKANSICFFW